MQTLQAIHRNRPRLGRHNRPRRARLHRINLIIGTFARKLKGFDHGEQYKSGDCAARAHGGRPANFNPTPGRSRRRPPSWKAKKVTRCAKNDMLKTNNAGFTKSSHGSVDLPIISSITYYLWRLTHHSLYAIMTWEITLWNHLSFVIRSC